MTTPTRTSVVTRITFKPDSAGDFLFADDVAAGRLVQEHDSYTLEEVTDFVNEFRNCIDDLLILVDGQRVITLEDFGYTI